MIVDLTWTEVRVAGLTGIDRNIRTIYEGRHRGGGQTVRDGWTDHITGALAEIAVAKWLGRYPSREARDLDGDVGPLQVRSTVVGSCLIVASYDPEDATYVLVVGYPPRLEVAGWMTGVEAKQARYWRTDCRLPAYWVPRSDLADPATMEISW